MARSDWISVGISKKIIEELDEFLKTEEARKMGVSNRQQILSLLLKRFLENRSIDTDTGITDQMYKIENEIPQSPEIEHLVFFSKTSERGMCS